MGVFIANGRKPWELGGEGGQGPGCWRWAGLGERVQNLRQKLKRMPARHRLCYASAQPHGVHHLLSSRLQGQGLSAEAGGRWPWEVSEEHEHVPGGIWQDGSPSRRESQSPKLGDRGSAGILAWPAVPGPHLGFPSF